MLSILTMITKRRKEDSPIMVMIVMKKNLFCDTTSSTAFWSPVRAYCWKAGSSCP